MRIVVRDTPAPQGSKRHVGRGVMVEMSKNVKPWREAVRGAAEVARFEGVVDLHSRVAPLEGPVRCWVTFTVRKPASAPKGRKTWPAKRPDVDKLLRSTLDALGSAGVWLDDAQVVDVRGVKVYPGEGVDALEVPGAVIDVEAIA
jgi:Holliday junction resolvase RusA-like endonuclease